MAAEYQIWLSTPFGVRSYVLPLEAVTSLSYSRSVNAVGSLSIECIRSAIPDSWAVEDARAELWRKPEGGIPTLEGEGPWLLSKAGKVTKADGSKLWRFNFENLMTLLQRRCVLYYANTANRSSYTATAENLLKDVFFRNFYTSDSPWNTVGSVTSRSWSTYMALAAVQNIGPSTTKQFAWRNVLPVMQEVAKSSAANGTPMFFDLVQSGSLFEYRVYTGQRGVDRSGSLIISPERGSLGGDVESTTDWSNTATVVLAGGQGQDAARLIGSASNATAAARSPFGRREAFVDATQVTTSGALATEAYQELQARRAKRTLSGELVSVPGAVYGIDWGFGDKLTAEFENERFTATVDAVAVSLIAGNEDIKAAIRGDAA